MDSGQSQCASRHARPELPWGPDGPDWCGPCRTVAGRKSAIPVRTGKKPDLRTWLQGMLKAEAESLSTGRRTGHEAASACSHASRKPKARLGTVCSQSSVSSSMGTDGGDTSTWRTEWRTTKRDPGRKLS